VSTLFGGIPDVVEDGVSGLLVPPGDREALLRALRRIVADSDLRQAMGSRARRAFVETRSSAVILEKLEGHYRRLLGSPRAPRGAAQRSAPLGAA
jgi:glycosyltransferase involved in cell wall biosynthesis